MNAAGPPLWGWPEALWHPFSPCKLPSGLRDWRRGRFRLTREGNVHFRCMLIALPALPMQPCPPPSQKEVANGHFVNVRGNRHVLWRA
jgi:hypothetical protein